MGELVSLTATDGHALGAYVARPEGAAKGGLVVVQEIFGVNAHIRAVTDGFARDGYLAVAPALFDRIRPGIELGYDAEAVAEGRALRPQVPWEATMHDVAAAIGVAAEAGKAGVIGYCWGGSVAWLSACRLSPAAAVCYYGGHIHEFRDEKPACPVMFHFGEEDAGIPLDQAEAVHAAHPDCPFFTYPAGHGFNCDLRGSYHAESAALARQRSLDFLAPLVGQSARA
ncbi:dienelactone hydrolase family protein [Pelagibius sp.]|uniref:dienelactone hydrolase family protein n=1 Tax=Pelagibius sp. TaxID=1931238 RepID=UPI002634EE7C|nr:dienelactone hydrolase family protein [Pelagibius sp.]